MMMMVIVIKRKNQYERKKRSEEEIKKIFLVSDEILLFARTDILQHVIPSFSFFSYSSH
jgi:hypothetical protein